MARTDIYTLSLHDALPILMIISSPFLTRIFEPEDMGAFQLFVSISAVLSTVASFQFERGDRKSTRLNSSHVAISYAVVCLKKKKNSELNVTTRNFYTKTGC